MPLPVCRPKHAKRCRFAGAKWGYGTQGKFYGYKLHAWILPSGEIVQYSVKSANMYDITASYELNVRWPKYGGPHVIGDKGYCGLGYIYPPKKNTRYDTDGGMTTIQNCEKELKRSSLNSLQKEFARFRLKPCAHYRFVSSWRPSRTTSLSPKRGLLMTHDLKQQLEKGHDGKDRRLYLTARISGCHSLAEFLPCQNLKNPSE